MWCHRHIPSLSTCMFLITVVPWFQSMDLTVTHIKRVLGDGHLSLKNFPYPYCNCHYTRFHPLQHTLSLTILQPHRQLFGIKPPLPTHRIPSAFSIAPFTTSYIEYHHLSLTRTRKAFSSSNLPSRIYLLHHVFNEIPTRPSRSPHRRRFKYLLITRKRV